MPSLNIRVCKVVIFFLKIGCKKSKLFDNFDPTLGYAGNVRGVISGSVRVGKAIGNVGLAAGAGASMSAGDGMASGLPLTI